MKLFNHLSVAVIFATLLGAGALFSAQASQNLVSNGGFEAVDNGSIEGWSVEVTGGWVGEGKIPAAKIVSVSSDARSGNNALVIDTTDLNPCGTISNELRTWYEPKYKVVIKQVIDGVEPDSWYMVKFRVKSPGIDVDEGLRLPVRLIPPTPRDYKKELGKWSVKTWERTAFFPQVPKSDGEYHEYVQLKHTYPNSEKIEIGISLRAPWTGKIIIDDVEMVKIDPAESMTNMEKLLAMRYAKPITEVRKLSRETTLTGPDGPRAVILVPETDKYTKLAKKIRKRVKQLTGASLPIVTALEQIGSDQNIVAIGPMMDNELVARLHFNRYVKVDALSPGPGGYVIWTVCEPYGLARKQNVIVVAGSDARGQIAAVAAFCKLLTKPADKNDEKTIELPYLHTVFQKFPKKEILPEKLKGNRKQYGFEFHRWPYAVFAKWYLPRWLETGDPEVVKLARDDLFELMEYYFAHPHKHSAWDTYEVGFAWDAMEEVPVLTDEDRLKITNFLLGYMHMRPTITSDWRNMVPRLVRKIPTWNHQAKGLSAAYTMGRYFQRYYGDTDPRFDYYLAAPRNAFRQQALWSKPQENSGNYTHITMKFAISYYLGEWEMDFFESGAMRRYAEYFATTCNNKGWLSGFGHTFYGYQGWKRGASGFGEYGVPLALWYYKDGRFLWWMQHVLPNYKTPYHQDVKPFEWKELIGLKKTPLERGLWDPRTGLMMWGAAGAGTHEPTGDVKFEESFDKISFRENWSGDGQYMLLEGNGRGIHSGKATNQISKLSILGEDLLIGSTYRPTNVRTNDSVIVVKDKNINDPAVRGAGRGFRAWKAIHKRYPAYAALEAFADLPKSGLTRTTMRDYLGGTQWTRNIFWSKGEYFAMIDEVTPKESGTYYIESNLRTCPNKAGRWAKIKPRTGKVLEANRGYEVAIETPSKIKHYILTDGQADIVAEQTPSLSITSVMVRQVHVNKKLEAGKRISYINLLYGDVESDRKNYRLERISDTEGLIFAGDEPIGYFGTAQCDKTRAILPIKAKMFMLTAGKLAVAEGTSAGQYFKSETPTSREVDVTDAKELLVKLSNLVQE